MRAFTLLEVMLAFVLIAIVGGVISFKVSGAIEKKRFQGDVDRIKTGMVVAQKLAVASQADWRGSLLKEKQGWLFSIECEEEGKKLKPIHVGNFEMTLNKKRIPDKISFDFFASGYTFPDGIFVFQRGALKSELFLADLFQKEAGAFRDINATGSAGTRTQ